MLKKYLSLIQTVIQVHPTTHLESDLIKSWSWGRTHSQCDTDERIAMETISISHHDNTCNGHYGCNNLQAEIQKTWAPSKVTLKKFETNNNHNHICVFIFFQMFSYRPEHPWIGLWGQSMTGERQRPCGNNIGQTHQWRSVSSRLGDTGSWSVSTGLRKVLFSLRKALESFHPLQRTCCIPCQRETELQWSKPLSIKLFFFSFFPPKALI